jgi:hypothetical protein
MTDCFAGTLVSFAEQEINSYRIELAGSPHGFEGKPQSAKLPVPRNEHRDVPSGPDPQPSAYQAACLPIGPERTCVDAVGMTETTAAIRGNGGEAPQRHRVKQLRASWRARVGTTNARSGGCGPSVASVSGARTW